MRIRGLPSSFHTAAAHAKSDVSDDARARASMVAWIDERRRRGATRNDACRILGISTRSYNRWRATLKRHGIRALTNRTTTRRRRDPWKRREVREAVERLRTQHPCGKEKLAILLAREGIRVSASTVGRVLTELLNRGRIHRIGWTPTRRWRTQRPRAHARRQRPFERAKQPGELIQIDTLVENSLHETRYHFSAIDPTRKYAHARLYHRATSRSAERFLRECLERWPDPIRSIQVDNGSEFRGDFERPAPTSASSSSRSPPDDPNATAASNDSNAPSATNTTPTNPHTSASTAPTTTSTPTSPSTTTTAPTTASACKPP